MNGFTATLKDWLSDENLARFRKRIEGWWKSKDTGWKDLILAAPKLILKLLALVLLAVILVIVVVSVAKHSVETLLIALPPIFLLLSNSWLAGAWILVIGCIGFMFGFVEHGDELYGALILISLVATYKIDKKATAIMMILAGLAFVVELVVSIIALIPNLFIDVPNQAIIHVTWIVLGIVAIAVAWLLARVRAAAVLTAAVLATGYSLFIWGYAGIRWQEPVIDGRALYPDMFFYGVMLLVISWAIITARSETERNQPDVGELSDEAQAWLDALYERDKQVRVLKAREHAFLVKELQRLNMTEAALEEIGVTPEAFEAYATQRGIEEIHGLGIVRKDGTVNPNKLVKHGFRKDFLVSYGIEPEELLTGEVIDQEPEESDGSESLS